MEEPVHIQTSSLGASALSDITNSKGDVSTSIPKESYDFPKQEGRMLSYWLQGVKGDPLLEHRTTPQLPSSADIIIIGSGLTGTSVTKHCLTTWPEKTLLVLEAREFCSGATGRNAGHCKPDQYRGFSKYEKAFGTQQALKILENERQTWSDLVQYIRENDIDCDLWVGDTLDVPMTPKLAKIAKDVFESLEAAGGKVDHIKVTHDPAEAAKISRIKDAQACYAWPASTLYPWKLTAHIMRENLKKGVNLQTNTNVTLVKRSATSPGKWTVETDRGEIECSQVVHATNAYSSALEPSLRGLIRPSPHLCTKIIPPLTFTDSHGLQNSYGVLLQDGAMFSINPRFSADKIVLFGGSNPGQQKLDKWLEDHQERYADDSLSGCNLGIEAVKEFAESHFSSWIDNTTAREETQNSSWSGIIALSPDGVPFIGQLPGLPGQWVCAGHNGHGMARIFTAAPGLVKLMDGRPWKETELPDVYQITPERIERLKQGKVSN